MAGTTVHTLENQQLLEQVERESAAAARQLAETAHLRKGQLVVIGCSTSEVVGHQVGSWSTPEVADAIFRGLDSVFGPMGVYMAAQCCEHLNRALIVEYEAVTGGEIVNVVPQPKAGSSFATAAYKAFRHPVALEEIRADAGLDIGGTLIGRKRFLPGLFMQFRFEIVSNGVRSPCTFGGAKCRLELAAAKNSSGPYWTGAVCLHFKAA